jgi:hypothetical protein
MLKSIMDNDPNFEYNWISNESIPQRPYSTSIPPTQPQHFQYMSNPDYGGSTAPKVAIPRLAGSDTLIHGRRRSARACEPCRQRKIKCDGVRPLCGQCEYNSHTCSYEDVKRVRDQKRLGSLTKRVDTYETLLRELEAEVDLPTARKIKKALKVCQRRMKSPSLTRDLDLFD